MKNDEARLQLTIDVHYELGRTDIRDLERVLIAAADRLAGNGMLSGETEASVLTWESAVSTPNSAICVKEAKLMKKTWDKTIRRDSGLIEHIKDGCGHPAYGSVHWMAINGIEGMGVHGCDGACQDKDWQIQSLKDSVEYANTMIKRMIQEQKRGVAAMILLSEIEREEDLGEVKKKIKDFRKGPGCHKGVQG